MTMILFHAIIILIIIFKKYAVLVLDNGKRDNRKDLRSLAEKINGMDDSK